YSYCKTPSLLRLGKWLLASVREECFAAQYRSALLPRRRDRSVHCRFAATFERTCEPDHRFDISSSSNRHSLIPTNTFLHRVDEETVRFKEVHKHLTCEKHRNPLALTMKHGSRYDRRASLGVRKNVKAAG